jgi:hypothetical protein
MQALAMTWEAVPFRGRLITCLCARELLASGINRNILDTGVDSKNVLSYSLLWFRNINHN